jgi:hypothetical protein
MNTEPDETAVDDSSRRAEARRLLVATVDTSALKPKRSRGVVAALAAALFVIGALTGGAIASASPVLRPASANWWDTAAGREAVLHGASGGSLVDSSQLLMAKGVAIADLGSPPNGADAVAVAIPCQNVGQVVLALEGAKEARTVFHCRADSGSLVERFPIDPTVSYRLTVTGTKGRSIVVTWAWVETSKSGELANLRQQLNELEQKYNEQVEGDCGAAKTANSSCQSPTPTSRP